MKRKNIYRILIVNNAEPGLKKFTAPLENIVTESGAKPFPIEYKDCLDFDFSSYNGIILSGSPQGDDIVEHHLPYFQWITQYKKPILGICAGHHITGFLYGSKILHSEEPESGDFVVKTEKDDYIFDGLPKSFRVKQMHNDSITLPKNFELLATSKTCYNQMMKHNTNPLYTCQFHPEYYNAELIANFIRICK